MTKIKLPKSVLGVKIPRKLRKGLREADWLADILGSAIARKLLARTIVAAAGAAAAMLLAHRPAASDAGHEPDRSTAPGPSRAARGPSRAARGIGGTVVDFTSGDDRREPTVRPARTASRTRKSPSPTRPARKGPTRKGPARKGPARKGAASA